MSLKISSVRGEDAKKTFVEFFTREFREQQLGQPGQWFLLGKPSPHLADPVNVNDVKMLVQRAGQHNAEQDPVAWRLDFQAGEAASTLWALSSHPLRGRIEQAHVLAVKTALLDWSPGFLESHRPLFGKAPGAINALFTSGTGAGQTPELHTTAFLFNTHYTERIPQSRLSTKKVALSESFLESVYDSYLGKTLATEIGHINSSRATPVPRGLFTPLTESFLNVHGGQIYFDFGGPFKGEALFAEWRRQADKQGFGPKEVEAVLRSAREETERVEAECRKQGRTSFFGQTGAKAATEEQEQAATASSHARQSAGETQKSSKTQAAQHSHEEDMCYSY